MVNAAGVVAFGPLTFTDDGMIEELVLTNLLGPLWLIKRVVPALAMTRGFLVNISAVVAEAPLPGMVVYTESKAALTGADCASVRALRRRHVRVACATLARLTPRPVWPPGRWPA